MARRPAGAMHIHVAAPTGRGRAPEKMNLSNHRSWLAAVAVLAIAPVTTLGAVFDITVDLPTELSGNFQLFGFATADEHPTLFSALPAGFNTFRVVRDPGNAFVFTTGTGDAGPSPDQLLHHPGTVLCVRTLQQRRAFRGHPGRLEHPVHQLQSQQQRSYRRALLLHAGGGAGTGGA